MSIWGKIIGGFGGFAIGGPIGALLGGMAGHAFDKLKVSNGGKDGTREIAFTIGVVVLGAKMAKADGQVTRDEIDAFRQIFKVPPNELKNVARVFDLAREDAGGYEPYAQQIANLFEMGAPVLEDLLHGLFHIAKADNVVHPNELKYLKHVAEIFGFSNDEFVRIRQHHIGLEEADPYAIVGVATDASNEEIKSAWRRRINEHHPDRAIAQGLPKEFVELANEKLAVINEAYERIAKQRGIG